MTQSLCTYASPSTALPLLAITLGLQYTQMDQLKEYLWKQWLETEISLGFKLVLRANKCTEQSPTLILGCRLK